MESPDRDAQVIMAPNSGEMYSRSGVEVKKRMSLKTGTLLKANQFDRSAPFGLLCVFFHTPFELLVHA